MKCLIPYFRPASSSREPANGQRVPAKYSAVFRALQLALSLFASIDSYPGATTQIELGSGYDPDTQRVVECGVLEIFEHAHFQQLRKAKKFSNYLIVKEFVETSQVGCALSSGKSNSLFFFSASGRFLVKEMKQSEIKLFRAIAKDYCAYLCKNYSLLVNYYAIFCITLKHSVYYFTIMDNLFFGNKLMHRYDIKGSTVNRHAGNEEGIYKDLDLHRVFSIGAINRRCFGSLIEKDVTKLAQWKFLDYSMIIGVFSCKKPEQTICAAYQTGPYEYIQLGIIDIFTNYSVVKRAERFLKGMRYDVDEISAQNPEDYGRRFLIKMLTIFRE